MRTLLAPVVALATVLSSSAVRADDLAGTYNVKFEEVSTNCEHPLAYPAVGSLKIDIKGAELQVSIDRTPLMTGKAAKTGKISASSARPKRTMVEGMDGVFSVAGRVTADGMLGLVMVGEYQTGGRPLCTQSWNVSGVRPGVAADKPADKPRAPKK